MRSHFLSSSFGPPSAAIRNRKLKLARQENSAKIRITPRYLFVNIYDSMRSHFLSSFGPPSAAIRNRKLKLARQENSAKIRITPRYLFVNIYDSMRSHFLSSEAKQSRAFVTAGTSPSISEIASLRCC
jgi:hypothetical protein